MITLEIKSIHNIDQSCDRYQNKEAKMIQARTIKPLGFLDDIIDLIDGVDKFVNDAGNVTGNINGTFVK